MSLKVFVDLLSQPSRAIVLFLRMNNIKFDLEYTHIIKGDHKTEEFLKINPYGKVPAVVDGDFNMRESIAILRYLARRYKVPDHWYPEDLRAQQKVDEFLEWHHIGLRTPLSMYFMTCYLKPMLTGKPVDEKHEALWKERMDTALNEIEEIWLKRSPYLGGDKISIADLVGLCEMDQPRMVNYDPTQGRPLLTSWRNKVIEEIQPHYSEVTANLEKVAKRTQKNKL